MSLPSRERGLKLQSRQSHRVFSGSLPSRERGLKSQLEGFRVGPNVSLPSRERGLKFEPDTHVVTHAVVAPFTGAWIEI